MPPGSDALHPASPSAAHMTGSCPCSQGRWPRLRGRCFQVCAIASSVSLLLGVGLFEDLAGDADRGACRRPSSIEGKMRDGLDELVMGYAILERPLHVERHLVDPV